jgi:hypothetical protein
MAPKTNKEKPDDSEEEINARMEEALKRALSMPHNTDKEIVDARRQRGMRKRTKGKN